MNNQEYRAQAEFFFRLTGVALVVLAFGVITFYGSIEGKITTAEQPVKFLMLALAVGVVFAFVFALYSEYKARVAD